MLPWTFTCAAYGLSSLLLLGISCTMADATSSSSYAVYVTGADSQLVPLTFTPPSTLKREASVALKTDTPLWVTFDRTDVKRHHDARAYVIHGVEPGHVTVVQRSQDGTLAVVGNEQGYTSAEAGPVAAVVQHQCLYLSNYGSGSATILSLDAHGLPVTTSAASVFTFNGTGPVRDRQEQSHAHEAVLSPDGRWVYVCDLGSDRVHHIRTADKGQECAHASFDARQSTVVPPGTGPRHMTFYTDRQSGVQYGYLCNELAGTVIAFTQHPSSGALTQIGAPVYALPHDVPLGGNSTAGPDHTLAEVAVSRDGRFVYVSDRGDATEDHISLFARDKRTGAVTFLRWFKCGGRGPRHFSLSHDDRFLAVANEKSGTVTIMSRDDSTGDLTLLDDASVEVKGANFAGFNDAL